MTQNAIEIEALRKTYNSPGQPPKEALKGIDLNIPKGSVFGLLGANGAGKSTLINILAGLVVKTSGRVKIWGFDQDVNPRQSRAAIGVMPQELNLDAFFTPRGTLEVQAGLYGVPKAQRRTQEILHRIRRGLTLILTNIVTPQTGVTRAIPRGPFSCFWRPIRDRLGRSVCLTSRAAPAQV